MSEQKTPTTPTLIEKILIGYLKLSNASKGAGARVFVMMDTDGQMLEMCRYLKENPEATEQEIVDVAYRISRLLLK